MCSLTDRLTDKNQFHNSTSMDSGEKKSSTSAVSNGKCWLMPA